MSILLLVAIIAYGNLVLTGVAQEKGSRVVEVLLARMPARHLLAGKVAGIGLLGFGQFAMTALAALVATLAVDSVDLPAVGGGVLAWVVVWFSSAMPSTPSRSGRSDRWPRGPRMHRASRRQ